MARPWETLGAADTPDGRLELRRRGEREFLIAIGGRVLMNGQASLSELALGRLAGEAVAGRAAPRVLIGGLGMGCTLRACLDVLPARARVVVAELNEAVADWCRSEPLAAFTGGAALDPRVVIRIGDVADAIAQAARPGAPCFDAIVLDLYEGPHPVCPPDHPHYGREALARTRGALRDDGVFALWTEDANRAFEKSLARAGFRVDTVRAGGGGRRHVVMLARPARRLR